MKQMRSITQHHSWTESEVQTLLDRILEGKSYQQISLDLPQLSGKPLKDELECRKCLQADGAAYDFFPGLPIYWDFSLDVEISGEAQDDQDTSSLTEQETEEIILFIYHNNSGIDPSKFKVKRSTAFLTTKLWKLQKNDQMVLKIAGKHIEEKRLKPQIRAHEENQAEKEEAVASGVRATSIGHLPTIKSSTNAISTATAKRVSNACDPEETESEDNADAMSIDGVSTIPSVADMTSQSIVDAGPPEQVLSPLDQEFLDLAGDDEQEAEDGSTGGQDEVQDGGEVAEYNTSDSEIEDPPVVRPGQPRHGWYECTDAQVDAFLSRWAKRPKSSLPPEMEDRYFIKHARRWGMTAKRIAESGMLKTVKKEVWAVEYRIRRMLHEGKDVHPRTVEYAARRDKKASRVPRTTRQKEMQRLLTAIKQGQTPQQIVDSGIITNGINTVAAVKHRWESMSYRGYDLPPARRRRNTES
ncbi:MAG: hypothetical protein Q9201_004360 [Fulgogasparrea decipioides]